MNVCSPRSTSHPCLFPPLLANFRTRRKIPHKNLPRMGFLVAQTIHICQLIHRRVCHLPAKQSKHPSHQTTTEPYPLILFPPIQTNLGGPCHGPFQSSWQRLYFGRDRPRPYEGGNYYPLFQNNRRHGGSQTLFLPRLQKIWPTRLFNIRLRTPIHFRLC